MMIIVKFNICVLGSTERPVSPSHLTISVPPLPHSPNHFPTSSTNHRPSSGSIGDDLAINDIQEIVGGGRKKKRLDKNSSYSCGNCSIQWSYIGRIIIPMIWFTAFPFYKAENYCEYDLSSIALGHDVTMANVNVFDNISRKYVIIFLMNFSYLQIITLVHYVQTQNIHFFLCWYENIL